MPYSSKAGHFYTPPRIQLTMVIKVAVAGAKGRMGTQVVRAVLENPRMELVAGFDPRGVGEELAPGVRVASPAQMATVIKEVHPDVFVDFTNAAAAVENITIAARHKLKLVVGTTGFSAEQFATIQDVVTGNVPAIISPNFSIGVNIFWRLVTEAARQLHPYQYHVEVIELHHALKKDAPSGTAMKAAELIAKYIAAGERGPALVYGRRGITGERTASEIGIHAVRAGDIVGEHIVLYAGKGERLEIIHRAQSREAFAQGALKAIEWIYAKERSGIYSMDDMMRELEQK